MNLKNIGIILLFSLFLILSASSVQAQDNSTELVYQNQDDSFVCDVENNSCGVDDNSNYWSLDDIGRWVVDDDGNLVYIPSDNNRTAENFTEYGFKENGADLRKNNSSQNISQMSNPYDMNPLWKEYAKDPWAFMEKYHSLLNSPSIPKNYTLPDDSCHRPYSKEFKDLMNFIEKTLVKPDAIKSNDINVFYSHRNLYEVRILNPIGDSVGNGVDVTFIFNGKKVHVKTDDGGYASFKFNCQPGNYVVKTHAGNISSKNSIVVKPLFKTKNVAKKYKKSSKFTVKIIKQNGKSVFKKIIKITFKGKNYSVKTNSKGIATFNIPKNIKVGKYAIKTCYNGCIVKNIVAVKR